VAWPAFMTAVEDTDADAHQAFNVNIKQEPTEARQVGPRAVHFLQLANKIEHDSEHDGDSGKTSS
jgi:hypothetical protein